MADSNGASLSKVQLPDDVQAYAFRGAKLTDIRRVLEQAGTLPNIRTVAITAGINDRHSDPSDVVAALRHLKTWGDQLGKQVLFVGTPTFHTLKPSAQRAVEQLNKTAEDLFGTNYIQPIPADKVQIVDESGWGIHYSSATAGHVFDTIKPRLN